MTLVNNPQANGVERANGEILRHLRALVADERLASTWSDPTVLGWIQIVMNSYVSSGSGYSPYDLTYGSFDRSYFQYPLETKLAQDEYSTVLSNNLKLVREISSDYQSTLKAGREDGSDPLAQTRFVEGDFVFYLGSSNWETS